MLELQDTLPPGALCDAGADLLAAALAGTGALWWSGDDLSADATGAVTGWTDRLGGYTARPTVPNTGYGVIGVAGNLTGLQGRDGAHCGLVAEAVAPVAGTVTLAARYLPPHGADARTIVTFNTGGAPRKSEGDNYLYLSEAEGLVTVKDDKGLVELSVPAPAGDATRLVMASLAGERMAVTILGGAQDETQARAPVLTGAASLFIGCRNQRPGLLKTLGGALIGDVWLWPGRALLLSRDETDRAAMTALRRFWLWAEEP